MHIVEFSRKILDFYVFFRPWNACFFLKKFGAKIFLCSCGYFVMERGIHINRIDNAYWISWACSSTMCMREKKVFAFRGLPFFVHYFSILNAWEHSVVCYISSKFQTRICKRPWVDPKMHAFYNAIHKNVHHQRIKITDQSMHFHRPHYECLSPKKITRPDLMTVIFVQYFLYIHTIHMNCVCVHSKYKQLLYYYRCHIYL